MDACTCSGYLCSPPNCSRLSFVLQVLQWINPSHTRLALNEFQASCYFHHKSQSALSETNWLLRVSGCNSYLESLPNYIDGAPPWTPTNRGHGITSRPLNHDPETPPRDFKELRTQHGPIIIKQIIFSMHTCISHANLYNPFSFVFHIESIPFILPKPRM